MRIDGLFVEITGPTTVVLFGLRDSLRVNVSWTHFYETFDLGSAPWSVKPFRRRPAIRFKYLSAAYDPGATEVVGKLTVEQVMTSPLCTIESNQDVDDAQDMMGDLGERHLAVTKGGSIVGVVSVRDLLMHYKRYAQSRLADKQTYSEPKISQD